MLDRDTLTQTIYATFAAPYGEYITPALRQHLRICAGQAADRVLALQHQPRPQPRTVTVPMRKAG